MGDKLKKIVLLLKQFDENCRSQTPKCTKLSHSYKNMHNVALMHRYGIQHIKTGFSGERVKLPSLSY